MALAARSIRKLGIREIKGVVASDLPSTAATKRYRDENLPSDPVEIDVRGDVRASGSTLSCESGIKATKVAALVDRDDVSSDKAGLNR